MSKTTANKPTAAIKQYDKNDNWDKDSITEEDNNEQPKSRTVSDKTKDTVEQFSQVEEDAGNSNAEDAELNGSSDSSTEESDADDTFAAKIGFEPIVEAPAMPDNAICKSSFVWHASTLILTVADGEDVIIEGPRASSLPLESPSKPAVSVSTDDMIALFILRLYESSAPRPSLPVSLRMTTLRLILRRCFPL